MHIFTTEIQYMTGAYVSMKSLHPPSTIQQTQCEILIYLCILYDSFMIIIFEISASVGTHFRNSHTFYFEWGSEKGQLNLFRWKKALQCTKKAESFHRFSSRRQELLDLQNVRLLVVIPVYALYSCFALKLKHFNHEHHAHKTVNGKYFEVNFQWKKKTGWIKIHIQNITKTNE